MTSSRLRRSATAAPPPRALLRVLAGGAAAAEAVLGRRSASGAAPLEVRALAAMHRFHKDAESARRRGAPQLQVGRDGVPYLRAAGAELWRGLGFATAAARFFQMDLTRRRVAGRLSELLGAASIDQDAKQRPFGFEFYADRILSGLPVDQREMVEDYADGVNRLLEAATPWEYAVLGQTPAPWRPVDSVLVAQDLFQQLCDPEVELLEQRFDPGAAPGHHAAGSVPSGGGTAIDGARLVDLSAADRLRSALTAPSDARGQRGRNGPATGSNGWVLDGTLTASGHPLLANDIHLPLGTPSPLFFVRLVADGWPVHGFTLPGAPAIVAGANPAVCWGLTRLCGRSGRRLPADDPGSVVVVDREEPLGGGSGRHVRVRLADAGPVRPDGSTLHWTATSPGSVDFSLAGLLFARDVSQACSIARHAGVPPTSLLVADAHGGVGWAPAGRLLQTPGRTPLAGGDVLVSPEDVPQVLDPAGGLLVSANQELGVTLPDGGSVTVNAYPDARAARITSVLRQGASWLPAQLVELQHDTDASFYRSWVDIFLPHTDRHPDVETALRSWDGTSDVGARGLHHLILLHDVARSELLAPLHSGTGSLSGLDEELAELVRTEDPDLLPEGHADWPAFLRWCVETVDRYLRKVLGEGAAALTWGEVNQTRLRHPLSSRVPSLARFVEQAVRPQPGCSQAVAVSGTGFGAAMRMVADPVTGRMWVNWPGGQTADPLAPGYRAGFHPWLKGRVRLMTLPQPSSTVRRTHHQLRRKT